MIDVLNAKRDELRKRAKKGFTLMELLIVIAIIAILVAIAIPLFTSQLEKARATTSIANLRSAYSQAMTAFLTETSDTDNGVSYSVDDTITKVTVSNVVIEATTGTYFNSLAKSLPSVLSKLTYNVFNSGASTYTIEFKFKNGALSGVSVPKTTQTG